MIIALAGWLSAIALLDSDQPPDPKDVVAGPWGIVVTLGLIAATVFLLWNFTKQLKKAQAAKDAGVFGDEPVERSAEDAPGDDSPGSDRVSDG